MALRTTPLTFYGKRGKCLCNGLYLHAKPGTLTAIMGPSGCGKSVFLRLLTGYARAHTGRITIGRHDFRKQYRTIRKRIGFVPQAEIMNGDLTVGQSLDFRIRLTKAFLSRRKRRELAAATCQLLSLPPYETLCHQRIGSPESGGNYPSGGQRRRINVAHELLGSPLILFMDEPTSGLAAIDSDELIRQCVRIAQERQIPIIITIHQPSRSAFECFDDLLIVANGGMPAYYGLRRHAKDYFEKQTGLPFSKDRNPAEYVLEPVRTPRIGSWSAARFAENRDRAGFEFLKQPLSDDAANDPESAV